MAYVTLVTRPLYGAPAPYSSPELARYTEGTSKIQNVDAKGRMAQDGRDEKIHGVGATNSLSSRGPQVGGRAGGLAQPARPPTGSTVPGILPVTPPLPLTVHRPAKAPSAALSAEP